MENTRKWRYGFNRWLVLLFIVLGAVAASFFPPLRPHIQVAPEVISGPLFSLPVIGNFYLTNTLVASFVVYLLLILMAFFVRRAVNSGELVPKGLAGAMEALLELLYNLTESTAGKWAKIIFPWFTTIVLVVLLSNWLELIPFVDSVGWLEPVQQGGHAAQQLLPGVFAVTAGEAASQGGFNVVPWLRVPSTDLNFTVALAIISVTMTQVIGLRTQGPRYLSKFINTTTMFKKPLFGAIDFAVGLLETISELAKLLSFSFRLFGNIFAGSVLLFLVGSLIPIFAQSAILLFEFFIGLIQALVFGMLTMVFMAQATQGHGGEHD
ncbi:MAG: F0F1 ATP synthase subunit A [Chloroflexi bacterium]|nr:F0F1 ATP synthase subunit A [Chloroflexota bacterium]